MPRQARAVAPYHAHHVTQRGNYRQTVFEKKGDYRKYTFMIARYAAEYHVDICAYCLMPNHVHFIVIPKDKDGLARLFNCVHMLYSQYKHKQKSVNGHLWQGRFFSCILSPGHLYRAVRYVEQNPVRARLVNTPWDYIWSSARQHLGLERHPNIMTCDPANVSNVLPEAGDWAKYLIKQDEVMVREMRRQTKRGHAIGNEAFITKMEAQLGCRLRESKAGRPARTEK